MEGELVSSIVGAKWTVNTRGTHALYRGGVGGRITTRSRCVSLAELSGFIASCQLFNSLLTVVGERAEQLKQHGESE